LGLVADGGGEVGDLVDREHERVHGVAAFNLAAVLRHQVRVPVVHDGLQPAQGGDGLVDVGTDEHVGGVFPQAELDLFAVDEAQPAVSRECRVGDDE
jgi:hypothetical protein